jgi:hypothetical protein
MLFTQMTFFVFLVAVLAGHLGVHRDNEKPLRKT